LSVVEVADLTRSRPVVLCSALRPELLQNLFDGLFCG
jgi:hypothetical protein